jgi:hypothetical protein
MLPLQRDASIGRLQPRTRNMNEDGAAMAANPRREVIVEDDDHIVKMIAAPQRLRACGIGQRDLPIVVPVLRVVAPAGVLSQRLDLERCSRPPYLVGAIVGMHEPPNAKGLRSVSFALAGANASLSNGGRKM